MIVAEKADKRQPWRVTASPMTAVHQPDSGSPSPGRTTASPSVTAAIFIVSEKSGTPWRASPFICRKPGLASWPLIWKTARSVRMGEASGDRPASAWEDFCIDLMHRSLEEVRRMNRAFVRLGEVYTQVMRPPMEEVKATDGSKQAVYSAPDTGSFRAAKGKGAVSLKDGKGLLLLGRIPGWDIIQYKISNRTSRIGYIVTGQIADPWMEERVFYPIDGVVLADSCLTDDPSVSQNHQAALAAGQPMRALGCYNSFYAEARSDGRLIRGFMPLRDLDIPMEAVPEATAQLVGEDFYEAGAAWFSGMS